MEVIYCEQRSDEWFDLRAGIITASSAHQLSVAQYRTKYYYQVLAEQLTGECVPIPINDDMQRGIDLEPEACAWYENNKDIVVEHVGFVFKDKDYLIGCSPDGLVGEHGLVEIKCPRRYIHLQYIEKGPTIIYKRQVQFQMWVTGRAWCDFVTFNNEMPEHLQGYVHRIPRDEDMIKEIASNVAKLLIKLEKFRDKYDKEKEDCND